MKTFLFMISQMKILIFLVIFSINLFGQEIGVAFDGVGKVTDKKTYMVLPISGLNIFGKITIPLFQIEAKVGYQIMFENYRGWEGSLYLLYNILPPIYLIGGLNYHANDGYTSNLEGAVEKGITMPGLGAGIDVSSLFSFELLYHSLLKKEPWYYYRDPFNNYEKGWRNLTGVIKANFKFRWQL